MSKITCVGCGNMGGNIIDSFLKKGHELTIVDLNDNRAKAFYDRGAKYTPNLSEALDSKFIVFSVPDDDCVRAQLATLEKGALKNKIILNTCSEIPSDILDVERIVKEDGGRFVDGKILAYQGELGTKYGYMVYAGNKEAYDEIEDDLYALSTPPIFLDANSPVSGQIVDLVAICASFGFPLTFLEGIAYCLKYNVDVESYISKTKEMLEHLATTANEEADKIDFTKLNELPEQEVFDMMSKMMEDAGICERINEENFLKYTNKSTANHYRKLLKILKTNYES